VHFQNSSAFCFAFRSVKPPKSKNQHGHIQYHDSFTFFQPGTVCQIVLVLVFLEDSVRRSIMNRFKARRFCDGSSDVSNIYQCKTQEQKNNAEVDFIIHSCNLQI